ncbi:class I SAM-dependent methyltransferase [Streptomyces sp. 6N223]|uniref:class I SAM-dependent methyltransferase n=1 Tax=Streptomyces sp. 6N223 TaxID=3457412 RepID=UPI003FCF8D68
MTSPDAEPDFLTTARTFYDTIAADYAAWADAELATKPFDRAMLAAFADLVRADATGTGLPVAELGCGPGRITAHLHGLGVEPVFGIDLSPEMVAVARRTHPGLRFDVGSMTALDLPDASLRALVAWYSIIHCPPEELPGVFAEFERVLAPGGHALLAFQVGDEPSRITEPLGHPVSLDFHRRRPDRIAQLLGEAGLTPHARLVREPDQGEGTPYPEKTPQAYVFARKPGS